MKFLFLSSYAHLALDPSTPRVSGGAELQVALLAKELAGLGHEVVIAGADDGQHPEATYSGVRTRPAGRFHTGGLVDTAVALPRVYRMIREERPDYVCLLGWTAWLGFLLGVKRRTRLIYICGSDAEVDGSYRRANRLRGAIFERGIRGANQRFAMSEHQRRLMQEAGLSCAMYRNLLLPRTAPPDAEKDIDFLWVSRCVGLKRPDLFLDLAEALPTARFVMIMPTEDQALFEKICERAMRISNVQFLPGVPYREVQAYFDRAHVFVNTSDFEGFPNSFIQMGQGRGTILSLRVDPDGVLADFGAGRCAEGDWETFVEDARELVGDAETRAALQRRCEQFVAEWHDNARNVDAFLKGLPEPR